MYVVACTINLFFGISAKRINSVVRKTSGNENATIERMLSFIDTTYKTQMTTTSKPFPSSLSRSEEHTSELQSHSDLVCRLLLEKKKNNSIWQVNILCVNSSDSICMSIDMR